MVRNERDKNVRGLVSGPSRANGYETTARIGREQRNCSRFVRRFSGGLEGVTPQIWDAMSSVHMPFTDTFLLILLVFSIQ